MLKTKILQSALFIAFCMMVTTTFAQQKKLPGHYIIKGKVQFLNPPPYDHFNKVWLSKLNGVNNKPVDSTAIAPDGSWQLSVPAGNPSFYQVDIEKWDQASIYSDGNVTINSRGYDTAKIKIKNPPYVFVEGSVANNFINLVEHLVYRNYQNMIAVGNEMYYAGQSKDSAWIKYLKEKNPYGELSKDFDERLKVLIRANQNKPEVIYALRMLNWQKNEDMILSILKGLNKRYPWFTEAAVFENEMENRIAQAKKLQPGMPVPQISYPDRNGTFHGLEAYKGKILLIDFWASWCGPCRAAVPKLKELYAKYKSKDFEILSVSIDDSKSSWLKAMDEEKMPWEQLLSDDKDKTLQTFLFSGIPTLYLVDKQGKIIGGYTGLSENVVEKINSLFVPK